VVDRATALAGDGPGLVVDVGAGTGHHLAAVLDALTAHHGVALDVAKAAARRAARAHPRAAAVVCDVWRGCRWPTPAPT
jgi:23S rRNA (guanine745-N1)-methyltransferase